MDTFTLLHLFWRSPLDVNQPTHPTPLPEDPELSYRELDPSDIAVYVRPNRYHMFLEALADSGRDVDLEGDRDMFWDTAADTTHEDSEGSGENPRPIYGAEDVDDYRWTLLHWASYNGSFKSKGGLHCSS